MGSAPPTGLTVSALSCVNGTRVQHVELETAIELARGRKVFVWIHLIANDVSTASDLLINALELPRINVEDALTDGGRSFLRETDESIFLSAPIVVDSNAGDETIAEVGIFTGSTWAVSVTRHDLDVIRQSRHAIESRKSGDRLTGPDVLYEILDRIVDRYFPILDEVQDRVEDIEQSVFDTDRRVNVRELIRIRSRLLRLRRRIAPLRDAVNGLLKRDHPIMPNEMWPYFQDVYDHTLRLVELVDLDRDILASVQEAHLSMVSNRLNEVMRFMTALSTILMSIAVVSGIYGMNFKFMPELNQPWGYGAALGIMALVALVEYVLFKRKGWL